MLNVSVSIPDEVVYDTHLSPKTAENYVRQATTLFYYTKLGVSLGAVRISQICRKWILSVSFQIMEYLSLILKMKMN